MKTKLKKSIGNVFVAVSLYLSQKLSWNTQIT